MLNRSGNGCCMSIQVAGYEFCWIKFGGFSIGLNSLNFVLETQKHSYWTSSSFYFYGDFFELNFKKHFSVKFHSTSWSITYFKFIFFLVQIGCTKHPISYRVKSFQYSKISDLYVFLNFYKISSLKLDILPAQNFFTEIHFYNV